MNTPLREKEKRLRTDADPMYIASLLHAFVDSRLLLNEKGKCITLPDLLEVLEPIFEGLPSVDVCRKRQNIRYERAFERTIEVIRLRNEIAVNTNIPSPIRRRISNLRRREQWYHPRSLQGIKYAVNRCLIRKGILSVADQRQIGEDLTYCEKLPNHPNNLNNTNTKNE